MTMTRRCCTRVLSRHGSSEECGTTRREYIGAGGKGGVLPPPSLAAVIMMSATPGCGPGVRNSKTGLAWNCFDQQMTGPNAAH